MVDSTPDPKAHTRTNTDIGPDYCGECSDEAQAWVKWPCRGSVLAARLVEAEAQRDEAVRLLRELRTFSVIEGRYIGTKDAVDAFLEPSVDGEQPHE